MPQNYPKMCPVCNHPKLFNLSDHLSKVHGINGQERKYWLTKAPYSMISGFYLGFFVWGELAILKTIFEPRGGDKKNF